MNGDCLTFAARNPGTSLKKTTSPVYRRLSKFTSFRENLSYLLCKVTFSNKPLMKKKKKKKKKKTKRIAESGSPCSNPTLEE